MNLRNCSRIVLAAVFILGAAGCSKSPEEVKAAQAKVEAETTGRLVIKSNRPNTTVEAVKIPAAADATAVKGTEEGAAEQTLSRLSPGKYSVTARSEGWPDIRAEATVTAGQVAEVAIHFPSGSLKLDTVPTGATVKLGKATIFGKTPLTVAQLPVGDIALSLEYTAWPAVPYQAAITENQETTATVRLPHGRLTVDSFPAGAMVVFEGRTYKQTPLYFDPISPGPKKLKLQAQGFPPLEVTATVTDGENTRIRPVLANAFPLLDPAEFLRAVWIEENQIALSFNPATGIYRPKNDIVKNIQRERLYNKWQHKPYRFSGPVKSYDEAGGKLEFAEQRSELARYRVLAQLKPGTKPPVPVQKDPKDKTPVVLGVYGRLTAVEEPAWPMRVITIELTDADFLPEDTP